MHFSLHEENIQFLKNKLPLYLKRLSASLFFTKAARFIRFIQEYHPKTHVPNHRNACCNRAEVLEPYHIQWISRNGKEFLSSCYWFFS
ncbi:MAG TPA: hypothetical protein VHO92_05070 [Methanobacterium sp.]|nr:hypothetical protein [Methanobacterium sp.]